MNETEMNKPTGTEASNSRQLANVFRRLFAIPEVGVLIPLLGFIIIFYALNPVFLSPANVTTMLRAMSFGTGRNMVIANKAVLAWSLTVRTGRA